MDVINYFGFQGVNKKNNLLESLGVRIKVIQNRV